MSLKLRYVDRFSDRHGKMRYYFRKPGGARIPLPDPATDGFMAAYQNALNASPLAAIERVKGDPGSFDRLLFEYLRSTDFLRQKASSQRVTRRILEAFCVEHGKRLVIQMRRENVNALIAKKATTPAAANNLLKKLRALIRFGMSNGWRADDPTVGLKRFKEGEHHTWTEAEITQFEAKWPIGSRERTVLALALYTGQRRADIASMTWAAYDVAGGTIEVVQEKTGSRLTLPIHRDLRAALEAWPREHVMILTTNFGKPFSVAGFGNWFADRIEMAGLPNRCVMHGLRKAAARRQADIGCSTHEIASITGHKSLEEVERYTRAAEQKRLARSAGARMEEHFGDKSSQTLLPNRTVISIKSDT